MSVVFSSAYSGIPPMFVAIRGLQQAAASKATSGAASLQIDGATTQSVAQYSLFNKSCLT